MIQVEIQIATCSKKKSTDCVSAVEGDSMAEVPSKRRHYSSCSPFKLFASGSL